MASDWYNRGKTEVANGDTDLLTSNLKVMLVAPGYVFDPDADFVSDVVASEVSGTGYTGGFGGAGRKALTNRAIVEDDVNDRAEFDADDLTWTALNVGDIGGAIVFREATSDADSPLIGFLDPADISTNGGDITIQWDAEGILRLT